MPYVTQAEMVTRFGERELRELTDRTNLNAIDGAVVARAIADAEAECDSWLSVRYSVPLASPSDRLRAVAADIARYRLWADGAPEHVRRAYEDALGWLRAVAAGSAGAEAVVTAPGVALGPAPAGALRERRWLAP